MLKQVRASRGIAAGVGAIALLGVVSCAGIEDTGEREAALSDPGPSKLAGGPQAKKQPYKSGEILVRFKSGTASSSTAIVHARLAAQVVHEYRAPSGLQLVILPQSITVETAVEAYRRDPEVLYAEPNYLYDLATVPNDPSFDQLWGLNNTGQFGGVVDTDINAPEAWNITTGSSNVVLGLLDTGVDYNHPDLAANIFTNPGEIPGNGIDDDGNGWVDDIHGISTFLDTGDPMDTIGHGTHVSGTMAGRGNNSVGVAGVNWNATIVTCAAFGPFGAELGDILQCMDYFLELKTRPNNPVDIVATNNSWGGGPFSQALFDAIAAHRQAGMLFIAAAGNNGSNNDSFPFFPASYELDNIISVLAYNRFNQRSFFSNFGPLTVDVGAPGEDVFSTLPGNSYGSLSGTSMATPHVTGVVGLLKAQNPGRSAQQIKNLILTGGIASPATTGTTLSGRRIRADGSLNCTNQTLVNRFAPTTSSVVVSVGTPIPLGMLSITCDAPSPGPLVVTVVETGATIALVDGNGSGQFAGTFTPVGPGTKTLAFPNGDSVSVTAVGNYDPALVVPFDFPVITGTQLPLQCDDCTATIEVPFPIPFAGASPGLTTLHISSNGLLSFSAPNPSFSNSPLPVPFVDTLIAPFWDDLFPVAGGSIRFAVLGQAPSRQLVIEYRDVPHIAVGGAITFQVVFFEGSPTIRFNYADVQFGGFADFGASATVGIQVASGIARQFSFDTPSLSNNMSLLWTMGAPLAAAGPDQVVLPSAAVALDGTASHDFDGTIASYAWTQTAGTPVTLTGADTATPSFTAPAGSGTLTFQLVVTDNDGKTGTDTVDVIVDRPPVAAAGDDLTVPTDLPGTLDGTGSFDPDGFITGYQWTQIQGAPVQIQNAGTAVATFIAPPTAGVLVFQLTVTDQHGFTSSDTVVANVFLNLKPVARAGQDRTVRPGSSVTLDGTASHDPDGTIASYAWTVTTCLTLTGPCNPTLNGATTATPQFQAPASPGIIVFQLTVTDNVGATATDTIQISMFLQAPAAAIVAATSCVQGGSTVTLNGTGSSDADGTIVAYAWTQLSGPPVTLSGAGTAIASFTAPTQGTLVFALTVTDSDGLTGTAQVTIPIAPLPVADATASDAVVSQGATVTLSGSQSVGAVRYSWTQIAGVRASLSNASAVSPTFVAPRPSGQFDVLTFQLTVTDVCGITATDTISLTVLRK
ncbi:MAG TPA: S8 family serine peptidase [Kofleriaceae bacterium]|nr:S8 family serine peptidase [Kofleriaceae bacterium]